MLLPASCRPTLPGARRREIREIVNIHMPVGLFIFYLWWFSLCFKM